MNVSLEMKILKSFSESYEKIDVKRGKICSIDKMVFDESYASGVKVRITNIWKKPQYLDLGWFIKDTRV